MDFSFWRLSSEYFMVKPVFQWLNLDESLSMVNTVQLHEQIVNIAIMLTLYKRSQ